MSKPELVKEEAKVWRAVRMHLHGATNIFGMLDTNINLVPYNAEIQSGGLFLTNPRDASKGQLVTWAGIKTVLYERN